MEFMPLFPQFRHAFPVDCGLNINSLYFVKTGYTIVKEISSNCLWCVKLYILISILQALFPYLQQRFGCYTHEDKRLFCLAARHFYHSLGEDKTSKDHFLQTIKNVAQPRTPYFDLLKSIE
jgi:hypothetical protein